MNYGIKLKHVPINEESFMDDPDDYNSYDQTIKVKKSINRNKRLV